MGSKQTESSTPLWKKLVFGEGYYGFVRNFLLTIVAVTAIVMVIFAISGVWPPLVAVESDSMEPTLQRGDLVLVTAPGRFARPGSNKQGIIPTNREKQLDSGSTYGSVILYTTPERSGSPVIHRVAIEVERGENWYTDADPDAVVGDSCADLRHCPAKYDGYITRGDNNQLYDQASGIAPVVKDSWVKGVAKQQVPYLGQLRLQILKLARSI